MKTLALFIVALGLALIFPLFGSIQRQHAAVVARKNAAAGVFITWTAPAAGGPAYDGYRIYKSTDGGATYSLLTTEGSGATSATIDAAVGNKVYITAYNDAGESFRDAAQALAATAILTIE